MALKPFLVTDKKTGQVRIVKADSRRQVGSYLVQSVEITQASALDVVAIMERGSITVEDASLVAVDTGGGDAPEPISGGPAASPEASTQEASPPSQEAAEVESASVA